jgi:hypothetical protein
VDVTLSEKGVNGTMNSGYGLSALTSKQRSHKVLRHYRTQICALKTGYTQYTTQVHGW